MTLPVKKQDAYVQAPTAPVGDLDSGMQRSTANGAIGIDASPIGTSVGGAIIGAAVQPAFHVSIANPQPTP